MSITEEEYLLLSMLSYCGFTEEHYHKTIEEVFLEDIDKSIFKSSMIITFSKYSEIFYNTFKDILKEWEIFYVDNRTAREKESTKTGFYSVVFYNPKMDKYVIGYRGSELFPIEDAYKDFVEADLAIGIGKVPTQFYEGIEVYEAILNKNISHDKIFLTGHSLGGGIVQFVAVGIDIRYNYIPIGYTFNAVGINKSNIISIFDFINVTDIIDKNNVIPETDKEAYHELASKYINYIYNQTKFNGYLDKVGPIITNKYEEFLGKLNTTFLGEMKKNSKYRKYMNKVPISRSMEYISKKDFYKSLFSTSQMQKLILKVEKYSKKISQNIDYNEKIINYGHSKDFTFSTFDHVGSKCVVDRGLKYISDKRSNILDKFKLIRTRLNSCHCEDIFLPFFSDGEDKKGYFSKDLNVGYIASVIRKIIMYEKLVSKETLIYYYSQANSTKEISHTVRRDIIKVLEIGEIDFLYGKIISNQLKNMSIEKFSKLWKSLQKKLVSPYKSQDFFDIFIFEES